MVEVEDDGVAWIWIHDPTRSTEGIKGKILFFSPDRDLLIDIARTEIKEHGFVEAKVSRSLERSQTEYVLCLYDKGPARTGWVRQRHPEARCPGWKSDEDTDRGKYSQKYLDSLKRPVEATKQVTAPAQTPPLPGVVYDWSGAPKSLEDALDVMLSDADLVKKLRSVGCDVIITANVGNDRRDWRHRHIKSGRIDAKSWTPILKAWREGDGEGAGLEFEAAYGSDSGWAGSTPSFKEIEYLHIVARRRTPRGGYDLSTA